MIINDTDKIDQMLKDKIFKEITKDIDGIKIIFSDGTSLKIKTYQYQIEIE